MPESRQSAPLDDLDAVLSAGRSPGRPLFSGDGPPFVVIHGVSIRNLTIAETVDLLDEAVTQGRRESVYFVNAACFNKAARVPDYHAILRDPDALVLGDGIGVRLAGQLYRTPMRDNVNGTDLLVPLCQRCAQRGHSVFFLGAQEGRAAQAADRLAQAIPGLIVAGTHHGYFDHKACDPVIDIINASGADMVLVAFGTPKQERWIARHRQALQAPVVMGVGGLLDFFSGHMSRAPAWVRKLTLEWAYRLALEPRRLWRRYLIGNWTYLARVAYWGLTERRRDR